MHISPSRCSLLVCLGILVAAPQALPGVSAAAHAQSVQIGPGGVRIEPARDSRHRHNWRISEREAVRIARRAGIVDVNRVVRGVNPRARTIRVVIDARSGRILRTVHVR
jgi:hypothetical protein